MLSSSGVATFDTTASCSASRDQSGSHVSVHRRRPHRYRLVVRLCGSSTPLYKRHMRRAPIQFLIGYAGDIDDLRQALRDALEQLRIETGLDSDDLFGDRILEETAMSARSAHAIGVVEGAAIALGLTALEPLDQVGIG